MSAHEAEQGVLESFELLNKGTQNQEEQYAPVRMFSKTEITRKREMTAKRRLKNIFLNEESLLIILIVFGAIIGFIVGSTVDRKNETAVQFIQFPGEIFMRMLKMMIVPIIVSSIITGIASMQIQKSKKICLNALCYYMLTTLLAVILGIILVTTIKPGTLSHVASNSSEEAVVKREVSTTDTFLDLIRNLFPDNLFTSLFSGVQTTINKIEVPINGSNITEVKTKRSMTKTSSTNTLGLITFSLLFGIALSSLGEKGKPMLDFFIILNNIFMKIIKGFLWFSPIGVSSLIARNLLKSLTLSEMLQTLGFYMLTVILGLVVHCLIVLPLIYFALTRKNPLLLFKSTMKAVLVAFGTATSAGTLPVSMECLENFGVNKQIVKLVLPLGATMNMDGTALLEGVASITIAQMSGVSLTFAQIVIISVTATMASIGAAAIPSAGLVTLVLVLNAVGVPSRLVGILWSVDWILDRIRTSVNVFGDCVGAAIVHHFNADSLENDTDETSEES